MIERSWRSLRVRNEVRAAYAASGSTDAFPDWLKREEYALWCQQLRLQVQPARPTDPGKTFFIDSASSATHRYQQAGHRTKKGWRG